MSSVTIISPAKINLFLAITGRRSDGFHNLVSVVAPVSLHDVLRITPRRSSGLKNGEQEPDTLSCAVPGVPLDDTNLILRAAKVFRDVSGWSVPVHFTLKKRIPMGAGLGGGSSNAVAALLGLNDLAGKPLKANQLEKIAATLGSDCALFLHGAPVVMRGRGERIKKLPSGIARRLRKRKILIFKPAISINTAWAYGRLAARAPSGYLPAKQAEARLAGWMKARGESARAEALLFNNMEPPAFEKYLTLPTLLEQLRLRFGVAARMSGSGSACFALLPGQLGDGALIGKMKRLIRSAWGRDAFVEECEIL